jgi:uncharacterized membrane protein YcaP (DUF421 family)
MDIVIRASAIFIFLFVLLRLMGKRELAELAPFELVMLIVMGDLIQQGVTQNDFSVTGAILAIATFAFWSLTLNWLTFKSKRAEKLIDGEPAIVVHDGAFVEAALDRNRLTRGEVESEMRLAGIAHIDQVAWAVLETNGKISFIAHDEAKRSSQQNDGSPAR